MNYIDTPVRLPQAMAKRIDAIGVLCDLSGSQVATVLFVLDMLNKGLCGLEPAPEDLETLEVPEEAPASPEPSQEAPEAIPASFDPGSEPWASQARERLRQNLREAWGIIRRLEGEKDALNLKLIGTQARLEECQGERNSAVDELDSERTWRQSLEVDVKVIGQATQGMPVGHVPVLDTSKPVLNAVIALYSVVPPSALCAPDTRQVPQEPVPPGIKDVIGACFSAADTRIAQGD